MINIRPIEPGEWQIAKQTLYRIFHVVFKEPKPLEEYIAYQESQGNFKDFDNVQKRYFENGGVFLVIEDEGQIVGTGAIRQLEEKVCELKRVCLRFEYQGRGLGFQLITELLHIAREMGYEKIRLETAPVHQKRAVALYKQMGFYEIPTYETTHPDDVAMEMVL